MNIPAIAKARLYSVGHLVRVANISPGNISALLHVVSTFVFVRDDHRLPEMRALFHQDDLVEALADAISTDFRLSRGTRGRTLKLQRNAGM